MAGKDLYVVIAEMLRKQDQQSEILERIDSTLQEFMGLTLKQFEQQLKFNENLLDSQKMIGDKLVELSTTQEKMGVTQINMANVLERITDRLVTDSTEVKARLTKIEEKLS